MARRKKTKREKLYELYAQGFVPTSPEVKALKDISYRTAAEYFYTWRKEGMPGLISQQVEAKPSSKKPAQKTVQPQTIEAAEGEFEAEDKHDGDHEPEKPAPSVVVTEAGFKVTPKQGFISIGHLSVPYEDFGYSSIYNLLLVVATYEQACRPKSDGGFSFEGKLGDFCADCVSMFRRIFKFDRIREEDIRDAEATGVRVLGQPGEGDTGEREEEAEE